MAFSLGRLFPIPYSKYFMLLIGENGYVYLIQKKLDMFDFWLDLTRTCLVKNKVIDIEAVCYHNEPFSWGC